MRSFKLGAALALLGCEYASAERFPRAVAGNGFLAVPVGTVDRPKKTKRAEEGGLLMKLDNMDFFYATELSIGTPPQDVVVLVDTGSSELWVNPDCSAVDSEQQYKKCNSFGRYDPSDSKTPIGPFGTEELNYGDASDANTQTSATILYYADDISLGDAEIVNQTFGVVSKSDGISQGILGLAPNPKSGFDSAVPYSLVLNTMYEQGVIASRLFALDLRHEDSETGAVIYGGLDRNKFIGQLESVPIIRGDKGEYRLAVRLSSLGVTSSSSKHQKFQLDKDDTNVLLDSGTTISRLHSSAAYPILEALNAQDSGEGYYYTECSLRNQSGSIDFGFGDKVIPVPLSDFIVDVGAGTHCYVGVVVTTGQQILGDTVLRAGYFVFDWDNEAVHIGQAANCGKDDIVAIGSGKNDVADVTGKCKQSDAKVTGPSASITATASLPTQAYTTVYTVTSCPPIDLNCKSGAVTTQTIGAAQSTASATPTSGSGSGDDGDDDSAGVRMLALSWLLVASAALTMITNLM